MMPSKQTGELGLPARSLLALSESQMARRSAGVNLRSRNFMTEGVIYEHRDQPYGARHLWFFTVGGR
jgi:hypothetical protein